MSNRREDPCVRILTLRQDKEEIEEENQEIQSLKEMFLSRRRNKEEVNGFGYLF